MTGLAAAAPPYPGRAVASTFADDWSVEVAEPEAFAEAWRGLEGGAAANPYARLDWVSAYAEAMAGVEDIRVALVRAGGRPALILPLALTRRLGVRMAATVGGRHANLGMPLARGDLLATLPPAEASRLVAAIGRRLGVDLVALRHVPESWDGAPNPLAAGGLPSASPAYRLDLAATGEDTFRRSMKGEARKKLRNKERGLAKLGPVSLLQAGSAAEIDRVLAAFLAQKEARFRELGIADPFSDSRIQSFLRAGALRELDSGRPALELYGLMLGDRMIATFGGAASAERLSGMFLSFENGDAARFSPGDILVTRVIAAQCERGRRVFDLGVGDARYKRQICDGLEPLVDVVTPVTALGRVAAVALGAGLDLKRRVKADPRAVAALAGARRRLARLRGRAPTESEG